MSTPEDFGWKGSQDSDSPWARPSPEDAAKDPFDLDAWAAGLAGGGQDAGQADAQVPPPAKRRWPLAVGIGGGAVVVLVVLALVAANVWGPGGRLWPTNVFPPDTPAASGSSSPAGTDPAATMVKNTVTGFLHALAAGNAKAALSYAASQPKDKTFLTDAVLKAAVTAHPITNIQVDVLQPVGWHATATATYLRGTDVVMTQFALQQSPDGGWKLASVAGTLNVQNVPHSLALTIAGIKVPNPSAIVLFPGQYTLVSANPMITVNALLRVETPGVAVPVTGVKPALSALGTKKIIAATRAKLTACRHARSTVPASCGLSDIAPLDASGQPTPVNASWVTWSVADEASLANLKPTLSPGSVTQAQADISGVGISAEYAPEYGAPVNPDPGFTGGSRSVDVSGPSGADQAQGALQQAEGAASSMMAVVAGFGLVDADFSNPNKIAIAFS